MSASSGDFSSQSSSNGLGGPPQGNIPDALLERMMDRKLRMLDLEYEECLKATKSRNVEDYDQGPTGDEWDKEIVTDPDVARARGYEAFAAPSDGSVDAHKPETLGDDEWSEAWAEYRRECKEEDEEARAKGITEEDVKNQTAPDVPQEAPKPLSADSRSTILNVMKGIKLKPPVWAVGVPEEVWMERILSRAGYRGPATANTNIAAPTAAAASSATTAGASAAEKAKRKKKKAKALAKKAAAAAKEGGDEKKTAAVDDFSPEFPPVTAAAASTTAP